MEGLYNRMVSEMKYHLVIFFVISPLYTTLLSVVRTCPAHAAAIAPPHTGGTDRIWEVYASNSPFRRLGSRQMKIHSIKPAINAAIPNVNPTGR